MSALAEPIEACYPLFLRRDYVDMLRAKAVRDEERPEAGEVARVFDWTTSPEYKEINFSRSALTIDPAKACQPLGAVLCALGLKGALPYVHGSQGCTAYFRTYFNRHFKEPVAVVSDSMTEDSAVFGGQKNMFAGLENAYALYKPEIMAISTTCMAEVIGDDLNSFITNAKKAGHIPEEFPTPFAHTPSFVGSHTNGWDGMLEGTLRYFTLNEMADKATGKNGKLNLVLGFETYLGNYRVMKRMMAEMGVDATLLSDPSEVLDTPTDGQYRMYAGGTTIDEIKDAPNAIDTLLLRGGELEKTRKYIETTWQHPLTPVELPMGLDGTDQLLMTVSRLTGKPIPASLELERGRLVDMMADSHTWLHGRKFSVYGDPEFVRGMVKFLMELGAEPLHVMSNNGSKRWAKGMKTLLDSSPYGREAEVHAGIDLWHLRSLLFERKPDFLIGNSYGKYLQRDTLQKGKEWEVPLIRIGFPLFDRHHLHRHTTLGYEGAMYLLTTLVNAVLERLDEETKFMATTDYNFDLVR